MSSKAALVNEKHYQAKLLLQLLDVCDPQAYTAPAQIKAVEAAAVELLSIGLQLFFAEIAESCQLQGQYHSVYELQQGLADDKRSHAVVDTLVELSESHGSWLARLQSAHSRVAQGGGVNKPVSSKHALALQIQDVSEGLVVQECQQAFSAFVLEQRTFLGEW